MYTSDNATRAQSIRGRFSMGKVLLPRRAPWASALVTEMLKFPTGKHDDQVDVLSLFGRILNRMVGGHRPEQPEEEKILTLADINVPMMKEDTPRMRAERI